MQYAYSSAVSFRTVSDDYQAETGEVLFPFSEGLPTTAQLTSAFPTAAAQLNASTVKAQIAVLESSITERMRQEAIRELSGVTGTIISNNSKSPFYNMTSLQAILSVRNQIDTLRATIS